MGILFVVLGVIATASGLVMILSGIPVREFSFGNTLIVAGTVATVGGLVVAGLGFAIVQLRRIAETLQMRSLSRPTDLPDVLAGNRVGSAPARVGFPPKTKPDNIATPKAEPFERAADAVPSFVSAEERQPPMPPPMREEAGPSSERDDLQPPPAVSAGPSFPPMPLPPRRMPPAFRAPAGPPPADTAPPFNPFENEEPALHLKRDVHETPRQEVPQVEPRRPELPVEAPVDASRPEPLRYEPFRPEPQREASWRPPQRQKNFDNMWSQDSGRPSASPPPVRVEAPPSAPETRPAESPAPRAEPRGVAILKSGVVDGMGYTLYVDGSIEAELPQGTVRFGSIADLRTHLEKNS